MRGLVARKLAVEILLQVENRKAFAKLASAAAFRKQRLSERDRAFVVCLVQGVLRHKDELDQVLANISTHAVSQLTPQLMNTLRVGLYQLNYLENIPHSAIVNTCVEIARLTGHSGTAAFANGVLRQCIRHKVNKNQDTSKTTPSIQQLALQYSLNPWLVEKWLKTRGEQETLKLLAYCQTVPKLTLRTCNLAISNEGLINILASKGVKVKQGELVPSCLTIEDRKGCRGPISKLPGYSEGLFVVQDEAAAFVSIIVDPQPGQLVIDICAAPGGKTLHLAELMKNKGRIVAVDQHAGRLNLIAKNRSRLGFTNIELIEGDGRVFKGSELADHVLVDAPCTGTGVIPQKAELRFRQSQAQLNTLVGLQKEFLSHASKFVKPGGTLVYSTCSLEPEENEDNIAWFLEQHKEFTTVNLYPYIPSELACKWFELTNTVPLLNWLQLLPSFHGFSGFFVCKMVKCKN